MNKTLTKQVVDTVTTASLGDNDQRSAIGMARSWLDERKLKLAGPGLEKVHAGRDSLAQSLVAMFDGVKEEDAIAALAAARAKINEPFVDGAMKDFQAARAQHGTVGSIKKNLKTGAQ